jgi:hypothetical protein
LHHLRRDIIERQSGLGFVDGLNNKSRGSQRMCTVCAIRNTWGSKASLACCQWSESMHKRTQYSAKSPTRLTDRAPVVGAMAQKGAPPRCVGRFVELMLAMVIGSAWALAQAQATYEDRGGALTPAARVRAKGTVLRSEALDLKSDYGAKCDGRTDDTVAIQKWLKALAANVELTAPPGVCVFRSRLAVPFANNWTIVGSGPYSTVFQYTGSATTIDLMTISDTGHGGFKGGYLANFRITSMTKMTAGAALHVHGAFTSLFTNLVMDGYEGHGNLYNGYWFDGVGDAQLIGYDAIGQGDGIRVNSGLGGAADLFISHGRVSKFAIGFHVAGGVGGIQCEQSAFFENGVDLQIDNSEVREANREIIQGKTCAFDSATRGDNVLIDDGKSSGGTVALSGWIASSFHGNGINVKSWHNGDIEISAYKVYNNCLDGIYVQDPTTHIFIEGAVAINGNGNSRVGNGACGAVPRGRGFGINASVPTTHIKSLAVPFNNLAGSFSDRTGLVPAGGREVTKTSNTASGALSTQAGVTDLPSSSENPHSNAEWTANFSSGRILHINGNPGSFIRVVRASTVDNITLSAVSFTGTSITVALYECGTSATCASPTTIGSGSLTSAGTAVTVTVLHSAISAGDFIAWAITGGKMTDANIFAAAQIHSK